MFFATLAAGISFFTVDQGDLIDGGRKIIIGEKPIVEAQETPWPSKLPEKIAEQFIDLLDANTANSSNEIRICAARNNPASEICQVEEMFDNQCALKHKYWKGFVAGHLSATKIDLNNDGVFDYIIRGDSCTGLSYSYTWDVFVLLSQKNKSYRIALNTNSNRFDVMPTKKMAVT